MSELTSVGEVLRPHWRGRTERVQIKFEGEKSISRTKQSDREEADINSIVAKYNRTGEQPGMKHLPQYGDDTASTTLHESMNIVRNAEAAFASLPSEVRDAVNNDPGALLDLVADPEQRELAIKLKLIDEPEASPVVETPTEPAPITEPEP